MKKIFIILSVAFCLGACEDVVDLKLKEGKKELVVEASIDWVQDTDGAEQKIILSETSDYFKNEYLKISGASVTVKDKANNRFEFVAQGVGNYICDTFQPRYNEQYTLEISYNGVNYESIDTLRSPVKIYKVEQSNKGGIENKDKEIYIYFTTEDTPKTAYFLVKAKDPYNKLPFYFLLNGNDFQNQKYFIVGSSEDWKVGDKLNFEIYHISKTYFNYMSTLLAVADKYSGKPLMTPPVRVQGNVVNLSNPKENPLGAFRTTSCLKTTFVVE